jgi:phage tail sheath protein FI
MLQGGFNGVKIFNRDSVLFTNKAVREELNNSSRGLTYGPTVTAYLKALEIMKDKTNVDIQLLTIPGIRESYVTDTAIAAIENERSDAMFIMDINERDNVNAIVTSSNQIVNVKNTINDFSTRGINSSYTAAYFPNVILRDSINSRTVEVPPSVAVLGAFGKNDTLGHPWLAPAGFNRASLGSVTQTAVELSTQNLKDLQNAKINPIASFPGQKPVVWGQATLLATESAFERINVRRLLLTIRREVRKISQRIVFEPNRAETLAQFENEVKPILKNIKDQRGLDAYKVEINTDTTTEADILNYTIRGEIKLVPTKSVEAFGIDFVLTNQGTSI